MLPWACGLHPRPNMEEDIHTIDSEAINYNLMKSNFVFMKTKHCILSVLFALLFTLGTSVQAQVAGPSTICPNETVFYTWTGTIANNCSFNSWYSSNPTDVYVNGTTYDATVYAYDIGPSSFVLSHRNYCSANNETVPVIATKTINVNGVGVVGLTSTLTSIPCSSAAQTFTVTASSVNANFYVWTVSGGGSIANATNGSVVTITKPASCSGSITVSCTAKRSECGSYIGKSATLTIPVSAPLPSAIAGPEALCGGTSATYSVAAGPNSCWSYNWYFSSGASGMTISNPNIPNPTISAIAGVSEGVRVLKCTISACGQSVTLSYLIVVCPSVDAPTDIYASRLGLGSCYWKFTATSSCAWKYQFQINGGTILTLSGPSTAILISPGSYTVKARIVNGCGTSPWRTESFTLAPFPSPCMYKTGGEPAESEIVDGVLVPEVDFAIMPNPSQGLENLQVSCSESLVGGTFEVYNMAGARMLQADVKEMQFGFSTEGLARGLYFCRITKGQELLVRKLVITE
jgi:Secretion system C-terminal sorting domain/PKD-like domain